MKVKNWQDFQHFKDRRPPWIKLYREILDDPDWHSLSGDDAKTLIMIWLLASEDKAMEGNIPDLRTVAFRLRSTESKVNQSLTKLSKWLYQDDINMISSCHQVDIPETETETEKRRDRDRDILMSDFELFWNNYPNRTGKDKALQSWKKAKPKIDEVLYALSWQAESEQWTKDNGQFIPNPATYINQGRWKDEPVKKGAAF